MKLLVIGASGMAGHMICTYLQEQGHQISTLSGTHPYDTNTVLLDICNLSAIENYLKCHHFDAIINCAGLLIKACQANPLKAIQVNACFPHFLEHFYAATPVKIIHLSTDCVFSGENGPYLEDALQDGQLFYDRSKGLGELHNDKDLTFRMSIIGPDRTPYGVGLLNWFLQQEGSIHGYMNAKWNGITTLELAKAIDAALTQPLTGLYHLVPPSSINKYDLLCLIQQVFNKHNVTLIPCDEPSSNKILINTRTDFNHLIADYPTMINEIYEWIVHHPQFYPHYHLT